jgi:hypothetical protein
MDQTSDKLPIIKNSKEYWGSPVVLKISFQNGDLIIRIVDKPLVYHHHFPCV